MSDRSDVVVTHAAAERETEHWLWGHRVYAELLGKETFAGLAALALSGKRLAAADVELLDQLAVITASFADPRIWPLKITRIVASYGGFVPAVAAGNLCLEGGLVGPWNAGAAAETIALVRQRIGDRLDDPAAARSVVESYFEGSQRIHGFGVPLRKIDERVVAVRQTMKRLDREALPHWRTFLAVEAVLAEKRKLGPNIAAGVAAPLLDLGFTPPQIAILTWWMTLATFVANAVEGVDQKLELFRRFPADWVDYQGPAPRESPRALAAKQR